jgi:hypothetical protein
MSALEDVWITRRRPTSDILLLSYLFQVVWPNTGFVTTNVIQNKVVSDISEEILISPAMA